MRGLIFGVKQMGDHADQILPHPVLGRALHNGPGAHGIRRSGAKAGGFLELGSGLIS